MDRSLTAVIAKLPCLAPLAYTVTVIIGVTALVATEGPRVRSDVQDWRTACASFTNVGVLGRESRDRHAKARAWVEFFDRELQKAPLEAKAVKQLEFGRAQALRCAEGIAAGDDGRVSSNLSPSTRLNWREAGSICFWVALLLVPAWVFFYRRTRATSGLTVEQVEALAKRIPRRPADTA